MLLATGCCADPEVVGVAFEPRFELQTRPRIALFGAVLEGDPIWAYGAPRASIAALSSHYRVGLGTEVGALEAAPPQLRAALVAARGAFLEQGYRLADPEGAPPQAYVSLSLGTDSGRLVRLGLHVGGELEGVFVPRAISLVVAEGEDEDPCPIELKGMVRELIRALPPWDPAAPSRDP